MGDIVNVTIGENCQFFIDKYNNVYASGKNINNQIGSWWIGSSDPKLLSEPIHKDVIKIASSMNRTLFLHSDGKVYYTGTPLFRNDTRINIINFDSDVNIIDITNYGGSILLLSSQGDLYAYGRFSIIRDNIFVEYTHEIKTPVKIYSNVLSMDIKNNIISIIDKNGSVKVFDSIDLYRYGRPIEWKFKDTNIKNCICALRYHSQYDGYKSGVYIHLDVNGDLYFDNKILEVSPEPIVFVTIYLNKLFFLTISGDVYTFDISDPTSTYFQRVYEISPSKKILSGKNVVKIILINDDNIYIITSDKKLHEYDILRNKLDFVDV